MAKRDGPGVRLSTMDSLGLVEPEAALQTSGALSTSDAPQTLDFDPETAEVEREVRALARSRRVFDIASLVYLGGVAPIALGYLAWAHMLNGRQMTTFEMVWLAPIVLCSVLLMFFSLGRQQRHAGSLSRLDDPRIVGPLAELLECCEQERASRKVIEDALERLLPCVTPLEADVWTDRQRKNVHRLLRRKHRAVALSALAALEVVGDATAIRHVRKLATGEGRWRGDAEVRDAATNALRILEQRCGGAQSAEMLLRPASSLPGHATLLHPASGESNRDSAALLRPSRTIPPNP